MERSIKALIVTIAGMFILACASGKATTAPTAGAPEAAKPASFLMGYEKDLRPGPEGGAKERWVKPGVDFSKYNKVMLDSVTFFFDPNSGYQGIDPQVLKELADKFNKTMVDTLKASYRIVAEPGPDVLRVRTAITGLDQSRPVLSGVSSVVPIGLGISLVKRGATGAWTGSGATGAEMMVLDSMSNDVLAVARDRRTAGFTERFSRWGSAEEAFRFWADRIKLSLDQAHGPTVGKK